MTAYDLGDQAILAATFTVAGVPTDPDTVSAVVRKPDGTTASYVQPQITRVSAGVYHLQLTVALPGFWEYEFTGTGAAADVTTGNFYVLPDPTVQNGRDLCRLADVAARVPGYTIGVDGSIDAALAELITQESRDFVETTGREIVAMAAGPRIFDLTASNIARRSLRVGDAAAVTAVELFDYDGITSLGVIDPSFYLLEPRLRDDWQPIRRISFPYRPNSALLLAPGRTLKITGTWGFPLIPATVRRAVATLVVLRYLTDAAAAGTQFAELANQPDFNMAASLRAALDARDRLRNPGFA